MFKALFEYLENAENNNEVNILEKDKGFNSPFNFIQNIEKFAFYQDLKKIMNESGLDIANEIAKANFSKVIAHLVKSPGLEYGDLPKGLLKFHAYETGNRVSLEEHLVEAAGYATSGDGIAYVHFTVSPEHMEKFQIKVDEVLPNYESEFNIKYDVSFSIQKPSTDTLAVDMDNNPFREPDGNILFRPAGHGALIENLAETKVMVSHSKQVKKGA